MATKWVYFFGNGKAEGKASDKNILGGKGANLAEMTNIGLPVPPGFTISCQACGYYAQHNEYPEGMMDQVLENLKHLEAITGKKLGDHTNPLLVSVRSGAAVSMPGMMDTVLNLGLNPEVVEAVVRKTGNPRFAWDSYRRFMQMFGDVVMGVKHEEFEKALAAVKAAKGVKLDTELDADDLKLVTEKYREVYVNAIGSDFPTDPMLQLTKAIDAVFGSWDNPRAKVYRQMNDIRGLDGTAVNVQSMVFGNTGETSGTGVAFTRNPSDGENKFYGEYLMNAQGEDVVAGIRTPQPITTLEAVNKTAYDQLVSIRDILENHYKEIQDIEFTIEDGKLYMLQTRNGKRTIFSWLRTQIDLVEEGKIDMATAIKRVPANEFSKLFAPILDADDMKKNAIEAIGNGLNASPGAAAGVIALSAEDAQHRAKAGQKVILVRTETTPEDIQGMAVSQGVLTALGGMTSHAAVVARGMGCPCVSGASCVHIDEATHEVRIADRVFHAGDWISIDGFNGKIYPQRVQVKDSEILQVLNGKMKAEDSWLYRYYDKFMKAVDEARKIQIRTNADTPEDTRAAVRFGAQGIGLTRTEHMFFQGHRIVSMRKMICSETKEARVAALNELLPMQKSDFIGIFKALEGRPANIRLIDPPLHEFLPGHDNVAGQQEVADQLHVPIEKVRRIVNDYKEMNPMLGFRGCRLVIVHPEILEMQVRAIIEAALDVSAEGMEVHPEIMIPLVGEVKEFRFCKTHVIETAEKVFAEYGRKIEYKVGTMIEVPRAALKADEIGAEAEFFSFGTNDLTQMTCGFSRDDSSRFLTPYVQDADKQFYDYDPFQVLDQAGVGLLMKMAVEKGRTAHPGLKIGICGEHGGEPRSVAFCASLGLDYVSCSPFRVPVARLAAAQAALM